MKRINIALFNWFFKVLGVRLISNRVTARNEPRFVIGDFVKFKEGVKDRYGQKTYTVAESDRDILVRQYVYVFDGDHIEGQIMNHAAEWEIELA